MLFVKLVLAWAIVNCIWFVKDVPIAESAYVKVSEVAAVPPSTVHPSNIDPLGSNDIVSVAFCAQAVTSNATSIGGAGFATAWFTYGSSRATIKTAVLSVANARTNTTFTIVIMNGFNNIFKCSEYLGNYF